MGNEAREFLKTRAKGASASVKKIGQKDILGVPFPDIDLCEQHEIVICLDSIRAEAEELKRQQQAIQAELAR